MLPFYSQNNFRPSTHTHTPQTEKQKRTWWFNDSLLFNRPEFMKCTYAGKEEYNLIPIYDIRNKAVDNNNYSKDTEQKEILTFNIYCYKNEKLKLDTHNDQFIITDKKNHVLPFFVKNGYKTIWSYIFQLSTDSSDYVELPRSDTYPSNHYMSIFNFLNNGSPYLPVETNIENYPVKEKILFNGYLGADNVYKSGLEYEYDKENNTDPNINPTNPALVHIGTIRVIESKKFGIMILDDYNRRLYHYAYLSLANHMFELDNDFLISLKDEKY